MFIEGKDDGGGGDNWTTGAISRAKAGGSLFQHNTTHTHTHNWTWRRTDRIATSEDGQSQEASGWGYFVSTAVRPCEHADQRKPGFLQNISSGFLGCFVVCFP